MKKMIQMKNVDLVTPTGNCLAQKVTVTVKVGQGLIVDGVNGCGKTSFFRVLAGLWPLRNKEAEIVRPKQLFLIPQRVYSVSGSLFDQVTYPKRIKTPDDDDKMAVIAALEAVGLGYLVQRHGLKKSAAWEDVTSLGEQQRMGIARVIFNKPAFAVLDECTDAVSAEAEIHLYNALHHANVTCITISKRLNLSHLHFQELTLGLDSTEGWSVRKLGT